MQCLLIMYTFSSRALDEVPLLDDRRPLDLLRLDRGQRRLMVVWPQVRVHVVVNVLVLVDDAWFAVHVLVPVVCPFHHALWVSVVVVRLIIGTSPLVGHVVLDAQVRWPARRGLPVNSKVYKCTHKKRRKNNAVSIPLGTSYEHVNYNYSRDGLWFWACRLQSMLCSRKLRNFFLWHFRSNYYVGYYIHGIQPQ